MIGRRVRIAGMPMGRPMGCTVVWSEDNDDGDGPAWIANLVYERDGVTVYGIFYVYLGPIQLGW